MVYNWQVSNSGLIMGYTGYNAETVKWADVNSVTTGRSAFVNYDNCLSAGTDNDNIAVQITPTIRIYRDSQVCMGDVATASAKCSCEY